MHNIRSSPIVTQVTFSGNSANFGGGMSNSRSSPIITQVTFFGNSASSLAYGGGMLNFGNRTVAIILSGVTFVGNTANTGAGLMMGSSSRMIISSTIFWGNTKSDKTTTSQIRNDKGVNLIAHSIIQGVTADTTKGISITNPNLVALANNGGFVQTTAIGATSSAKDKGLYFATNDGKGYYSSDNTTWYTTPLLTGTSVTLPSDAVKYTTDARSYSHSGRPDMGAYEYGGTAPQ